MKNIENALQNLKKVWDESYCQHADDGAAVDKAIEALADVVTLERSCKTEVSREVLEAILNAAQDGAEPCVEYSRDPAEFARRAAALSIKKCGQIAEIVKAVLAGDIIPMPEPDAADGTPL